MTCMFSLHAQNSMRPLSVPDGFFDLYATQTEQAPGNEGTGAGVAVGDGLESLTPEQRLAALQNLQVITYSQEVTTWKPEFWER